MRSKGIGALAILSSVWFATGCITGTRAWGALEVGAGAARLSPWEVAIDVRAAPGVRLGDSSQVSIHPVAAFARLLTGGVEGESSRFWHLGGQVRMSTGQYWLGTEATWSQRRTSFDAPGEAPETTNGWTVAGLAGVPLTRGTGISLHGFGAAGIIKYGGTGPYFRLGLELQVEPRR